MILKSEGKSFIFSIHHPIICLSFQLTMPLNEHIRCCNLLYRGIHLDIFSIQLVRRKSLATQLSRRIVHKTFDIVLWHVRDEPYNRKSSHFFPRKRKCLNPHYFSCVYELISFYGFLLFYLNRFKNSIQIWLFRYWRLLLFDQSLFCQLFEPICTLESGLCALPFYRLSSLLGCGMG